VLTIQPGAVVKFAPNAQVTVYGTLSASDVVFTSKDDDVYGEIIADSDSNPVSGAWRGIYVNGSNDYDGIGEFDDCRIRYGGWTSGNYSNVTFYNSDAGHFINSISEHSVWDEVMVSGCSPQVSGSTIENNARYGLHVLSGGTPAITGNTIRNNDNYPLYVNQNVIPPNVSGNVISGHAINSLVFNGTVAENQTWSHASDFPIVLPGSVIIDDGVGLEVTAGTVIKFGSNVSFTVYGTLDADGVVFTSLKDDDYGSNTNADGNSSSAEPGDWTGIHLYGSSGYEGIGEFD
jgi:parallel beta-helix repeat protein